MVYKVLGVRAPRCFRIPTPTLRSLPCLSLSLVRSFQDHLGSVTLVYLAVLKKNQEFETCDQRERRDRTSQDAQQEFIAGPGNGPCHLCHRGRCLHGLLSTEL